MCWYENLLGNLTLRISNCLCSHSLATILVICHNRPPSTIMPDPMPRTTPCLADLPAELRDMIYAEIAPPLGWRVCKLRDLRLVSRSVKEDVEGFLLREMRQFLQKLLHKIQESWITVYNEPLRIGFPTSFGDIDNVRIAVPQCAVVEAAYRGFPSLLDPLLTLYHVTSITFAVYETSTRPSWPTFNNTTTTGDFIRRRLYIWDCKRFREGVESRFREQRRTGVVRWDLSIFPECDDSSSKLLITHASMSRDLPRVVEVA
jgi:hypothetical protein